MGNFVLARRTRDRMALAGGLSHSLPNLRWPCRAGPYHHRAAPEPPCRPERNALIWWLGLRGDRCIRLARSAGSSGRHCLARRPNRRAGASRSRPYSRKACCGGFRLPGSRNRRFGHKKRGLRASPAQVLRRPSSSLRRGELSFSRERPLVVVLTQLDSPDKGFIPLKTRFKSSRAHGRGRYMRRRKFDGSRSKPPLWHGTGHLAARTYGQQPGGL
jgi:hypothetical protein